jgi:hypothetical protein
MEREATHVARRLVAPGFEQCERPLRIGLGHDHIDVLVCPTGRIAVQLHREDGPLEGDGANLVRLEKVEDRDQLRSQPEATVCVALAAGIDVVLRGTQKKMACVQQQAMLFDYVQNSFIETGP